MFYNSKKTTAKAKEMNQKCRKAGVVALDYEGNDSDMWSGIDTFYIYFPTKESMDLFNKLWGDYAPAYHVGLNVVCDSDDGPGFFPVDYHVNNFKNLMQNKNRGKTKQLVEVENFKEEDGTAV